MKTRAIWLVVSLVPAIIAGCCTLNRPGDCRGDRATIMAAPAQLHMRPACLSVDGGESVTLRLKVADGVRSVQTQPAPENSFASWLNGSAERGGAIVLTAPTSKDKADSCRENYCEYKFEILVDGVGMLDPRVQIRY